MNHYHSKIHLELDLMELLGRNENLKGDGGTETHSETLSIHSNGMSAMVGSLTINIQNTWFFFLFLLS